MKRLPFKPEFEPDILAGLKTFTCRWNDQHLIVGDIAAAVTPKPGKPGFLTPAKDAFCHLRITDTRRTLWVRGDPYPFLCSIARASGFKNVAEARDWYEARRPVGASWIYGYGFEVVNGLWDGQECEGG